MMEIIELEEEFSIGLPDLEEMGYKILKPNGVAYVEIKENPKEANMPKATIAGMEESAGISSPIPKMPYGPKERGIPGRGGVARPWTGPKPWGEKGKSYTPDKGDGTAKEL